MDAVQPPYDAGAGAGPNGFADGVEVGDFEQGSPLSRFTLSRYLVGRVIAQYMADWLLVLGLVVLALAGLLIWRGPTWAGVVFVLIALCVLAVRTVVVAILRRVSGVVYFGPDEKRLRVLVRQTSADVRRELRRLGLPSRFWTMPNLVLRLLGPRRIETINRLRRFEVDRAVPKSRLDELHLMLQSVLRAR